MSIDWGASARQVREALAHRAAGVVVVTARVGDELHGLTVTAWCSASLDPPLILVCVEAVTASHAAIAAGGAFGLTILAREQEALADRFAGRAIPVGSDFAGAPYMQAVTGAPLLAGGIGWLDCRVVARHPAGTHTIFVGEVVAAASAAAADALPPLIYLRRRYVQPSDEQ
jgi:flavin reductase (DIM6/NTAB) family NADH-FMN oxidoreductase RutF